jgi:general secretion pathway protein G
MKNRKRGFSLVELLIVLAVIAALIATITPVALNAIQKAKATQVGQNLKTLTSAIENKGYVDGATGISGLTNLADVTRDISADYEAYVFPNGSGTYQVFVLYVKSPVDVSAAKVAEVLAGTLTGDGNAKKTADADDVTNGAFKLTKTAKTALVADATVTPANGAPYYTFSFTIY